MIGRRAKARGRRHYYSTTTEDLEGEVVATAPVGEQLYVWLAADDGVIYRCTSDDVTLLPRVKGGPKPQGKPTPTATPGGGSSRNS